ncbi:MAG TPA: BamA/TamA family outer membrane protein, partial [Gemmatimonadaceae bacterium]|nr:BamA/TamA family outer membrane protein [Gemmatimonadaceae bacterium]
GLPSAGAEHQPRPATPDPHASTRAPSYAAATPVPAPWDSLYVRQIRIRGHGDAKHRLADRLAGTTLSVRTPGWVTPARLEDALARLYGSGHFERVTYAIEPDASTPGASDIVVDVTPRNEDVFGVGLRYDSERQAALLFSAALHDRLHYGSTAQLDVRLGEQLQFDARYVFDETPTLHADRRFRATYLRTPLRLYDGGRGVAEERLHVSSVSATAGHTLSTSAAVAVEAKGEYAYNTVVTAPVDLAERRQVYYTLGAQLWLDSFDRTVFPTRGGSLIAQSEFADRRIGSGASFSRHVLDAQRYLPLGRRTSLTGRLALGWTTGADDLPAHDRFYLGGSVPSALLATRFLPFYGLKEQQLAGRGVRLASLGAQRELQRNVFALARWDVGTTFDTWPSLSERLRYESGAGISLGAMTPAGPVTATLASRTREWRPMVDLEFGYRF